MTETSSFEPTSTKLQRIAELARQAPTMAFTTLAYHIDTDWMKEAYRRTRKNGAPGVDGERATGYAANLEENLESLVGRAKSGAYRAPPVRRVHIPKDDGSQTRPIGIPTFEDKVLQRAVAMALEAVYEQDFLDCSFGFRPKRSAHDALRRIFEQTMAMGGGWVLEVDVRKFFDTMDHGYLRDLLRHRVRDGVLLRLIGKWLNAGVLEEGALSYPEAGSPQGGVISPVLANVYLHEVLDTWFAQQVEPRLKGRAFMVRYADDVVMVFSREDDARRVHEVLPKRFGKVWTDAPPGEDTACRLSSAASCSVCRQRRPAGRNLRRVGLHACVGPFAQRDLGGKAEDSQRPPCPSAHSGVGVVPRPSAQSDKGAMEGAGAEGARALWILWYHR